jgi:hypothetical protein
MKHDLANKIQQPKYGQKKVVGQALSGNSNLYQPISMVQFVPQQEKQKH